MIMYEVSLFIDKAILQSYTLWLKEHIVEMLKFEGFIDAKILSEAAILNSSINIGDTENLIVQYRIKSIDSLNDYFNNHADSMRKKGIDKFGNQFKAQRRILNIEMDFCHQ